MCKVIIFGIHCRIYLFSGMPKLAYHIVYYCTLAMQWYIRLSLYTLWALLIKLGVVHPAHIYMHVHTCICGPDVQHLVFEMIPMRSLHCTIMIWTSFGWLVVMVGLVLWSMIVITYSVLMQSYQYTCRLCLNCLNL